MAEMDDVAKRFYVVFTGDDRKLKMGPKELAAREVINSGKSAAKVWPADAVARGLPQKKVPHIIENEHDLWIVTQPVRAVIEKHKGNARIEFLPIALQDTKGKVVCADAVVVHPLDVLDCGKDSDPPIPSFEFEKLRDAPVIFRIKADKTRVVIRYELASALYKKRFGATWEKVIAEDRAELAWPLVEKAIRGRSVKKLEAAFAKGATMESRDLHGAYTPLRLAVVVGVPELVEWLLSKGGDLNELNEEGESLLHDAGEPELIELLVRHGLNVNAKDKQGRTPLHVQSARRSVPAITRLLDLGADLEAVTPDGQTPLLIVAGGADRASVQSLLARGARLEVRNKAGKTPLVEALDSVSHFYKGNKLHDAKAFARMKRSDAQVADDCVNTVRRCRDIVDDLLAAGANRDAAPAGLWKTYQQVNAFLESLDASGKKSEAEDKALASEAGRADPQWAKRVRARFDKASFDELGELAIRMLGSKQAIAHPAWPELVADLLERNESLIKAASKATGKRMTWRAIDDIEGLESITDGMNITVPVVLELLGKKDALARPDWAALVKRACEVKRERLGSYSWGDDEIASLLKAAAGKGSELITVAREAFPYAKLPTTAARS